MFAILQRHTQCHTTPRNAGRGDRQAGRHKALPGKEIRWRFSMAPPRCIDEIVGKFTTMYVCRHIDKAA